MRLRELVPCVRLAASSRSLYFLKYVARTRAGSIYFVVICVIGDDIATQNVVFDQLRLLRHLLAPHENRITENMNDSARMYEILSRAVTFAC